MKEGTAFFILILHPRNPFTYELLYSSVCCQTSSRDLSISFDDNGALHEKQNEWSQSAHTAISGFEFTGYLHLGHDTVTWFSITISGALRLALIGSSSLSDIFDESEDEQFSSDSVLGSEANQNAPYGENVRYSTSVRASGKICDYCNKIFSTVRSRKRHERDKHLQTKSLQCDECRKWYKNRGALVTHKSNFHRNITNSSNQTSN